MLVKRIISIPYGAIKTAAVGVYLYVVVTFQFLMVQLKHETTGQITYSLNMISIPYGAIKTIPAAAALIEQLNFNSLWCN